MDRKRLIAGVVSLFVVMILCLFGWVILWNGNRQGSVGHREPLRGFAYCSSNQIRPCILSFNLNPNGGMLINIFVSGSTPEFFLKIKDESGEHTYECKRTRRYSTHVSCTGEVMPVGKPMSFRLVSVAQGFTLAEGTFPIIGMALATPEVYLTPTHVPAFDHQPR